MENELTKGMYLKEYKCPICDHNFKTVRLKSNASALDKKDEDFCPYYKGLNPLHYEIIVCIECAYAASEAAFSDLVEYEQNALRNAFKTRKVERDYCGIREWNDAIDSYKLALLTATAKKSKPNVIAGICLKIAWLYREKNDKREMEFLTFSFENYRKTYEEENPPYANLSEMMLMYLLGELARRLDLIEDSAYWLGKAIRSTERKDFPRIEEMARDQFATVRALMKISKAEKDKKINGKN